MPTAPSKLTKLLLHMLNSEAFRAVPLDAYAYRAIGISAFGSDGLVEQIDLITRATYSASTATTATSRSPLNALMRLYISTATSTTSRARSGDIAPWVTGPE